jgi:hypothetical protein
MPILPSRQFNVTAAQGQEMSLRDLEIKLASAGKLTSEQLNSLVSIAHHAPDLVSSRTQANPLLAEAFRSGISQGQAESLFKFTGRSVDSFGGAAGTPGLAPLPTASAPTSFNPANPSGGPALRTTPTGTSPTGTAGPGTTGGGAFPTGGFLGELLASRSGILNQQQQLLSELGPSLRSSLFAANPELAAVSEFLTGRVNEGIPQDLQQNFREQVRTAQAARGFTGGGTGPAGQEAKFLTALQEQNRFAAAQGLSALGGQIAGLTGLGNVPSPSFGEVGGLGLGARTLAEQVFAGQQQSSAAQRMFDEQMALLRSQSASGSPVTSVIVGAGGGGGGARTNQNFGNVIGLNPAASFPLGF